MVDRCGKIHGMRKLFKMNVEATHTFVLREVTPLVKPTLTVNEMRC